MIQPVLKGKIPLSAHGLLQLLGQLAAVGALGQMGMQLGLLLERERPVQPGAEEKLIFFAWFILTSLLSAPVD